MMMMKKELVLFTAAMCAAGILTGCGASGQNGGAAATEGTESSTTVTAETQESQNSDAAQAGEVMSRIQSEGVIKIGTEGTYSPNSYHDESGKLVGFDVEVGEKVAEKLGVKAEFVETKWDSLFASLDSGRIDIITNEVEASEERGLKYDFSEPYTYVHGALLVTGDNEEIKTFEDLQGKKAAQNLTSSWGALAESFGAELVGVESMNQSVELMLTGRADATVNAETAFYDFMKNQPDQDVKIAAKTDTTTSSVIPVVKGNEDLVEAVNMALDEMRESGELAELSEKYFVADVTSK